MTATPETVFAARLSYAMEARGMSSNRLAALIGAQAKTVLNWRSGHRMPKLATLPALCVALGVGAGCDGLWRPYIQQIPADGGDSGDLSVSPGQPDDADLPAQAPALLLPAAPTAEGCSTDGHGL